MRIFIYIALTALFIIPVKSQSWNELFGAADSLFELNKYDESLEYALKAAKYADDNMGKDSKPYSNAVNLIGIIYFKKGNFDQAVYYFTLEKEAKRLAYGTESPNYAKALNNLSSVLSQLGRDREAEPIMREALDLKMKTVGEYDTSFARSANNLGVVCFNLGNLNDAERYLLIAAKIRKKRIYENQFNYAVTAKNLGSLYKVLGNYSEAEKNLREAYDIFVKELGEFSSEALGANSELAMTYLASGNTDKAKPILDKVQLQMKNSIGTSHPDYLFSSYNLAMYYWSIPDYEKAESMLVEIMNTVETKMGNGHPLFTSCLNSLGLIYWQTGDLQKANMHLGMAVNLREKIFGRYHPEYATSLHNLAALQKEMGNFEEAEKNYHDALDLYVEEIKNIFPFLSDAEKAKFYSNLKERFDLFNLYVLSRKDDNPALLSEMYNFRLMTKGVLLDASRKIRRKILETNNPELITKYNQWRTLKEELSQLYSMTKNEVRESGKNIDELEQKANSLEKSISDISDVFDYDIHKDQISWLDIQKSLKKDEAAIELIRVNMFDRKWLDTAYYAALIITNKTKDNPELVLLSNGYYLDNHYIRNYLNSIRFQIEDKISYQVFWEKIDKKLDGIKTVYISKDGVYNKININTLQKPLGNYVIDDMNIVVVSKTSDIVNRRKDKVNRTAYLFGNPKYAMSDEEIQRLKSVDEQYPVSKVNYSDLAVIIPELPGTEKELTEINSMLKDKRWDVNSKEGLEANEASFKNMGSAGLVHLATHGYFLKNVNSTQSNSVYGVDIKKAAEDPMLRSGLLFAGATNFLVTDTKKTGENENGILTAYEASSLELDEIDLLVLSACETGLGEVKNGEGVYGLQRAFQIAGAKNLVMSLWKVNDRTTQQLMTYFYEYWLKGSSISEALHKAQKELKEEWEHPYYWGGFIVIQN